MAAQPSLAEEIIERREQAGRYLPEWTIGNLPTPPPGGWRLWVGLIGPGVVLAGTSIGSGEWLFGPGVTAQYGAALLWLALLSIVLQAFCNLAMMRYAVYSGEPIIVGGLRTWPGPGWWIGVYLILDIAGIWPYNASNAAVPLAAVILGHLPQTASDQALVKALGFAVFILAFVPLIFGGTVYRMLEKIMTAKLVLVLGYLSIVALALVSWPVVRDVATGFVAFGTIPLRAETIILERHFSLQAEDGTSRVQVRGTWEQDGQPTGDIFVTEGGKVRRYNLRAGDSLPPPVRRYRDDLLARAKALARPGGFLVRAEHSGATLEAEGEIVAHHLWRPSRLIVHEGNMTLRYDRLAAVPEPHASRFKNLLDHEGVEYVGLLDYVSENGRLPALDWAMVVAFIGIAGAGGLSNTLFSNYARDKGWGMGARVGAIPSAIGGRTIGLSHTGCVFPLDTDNLTRWGRWMRHIRRDQLIWVLASILGMALPCMISLEFIRNATVTGDRVAAMTAEGIALRYPSLGGLFWILTLLCGFLVLAPGQVSVGDQIARRWTDMIWTASARVKRLGQGEVRYLYYGILIAYGLWGLFVLWLLPALQIAKIGAVLGNVALGVASLQTLYVNQRLLPSRLRPHPMMQLGVFICGLFFLGISIAVIATL
jgi:Mn2+/Fe2+ NRAMP family transporter